MTAVDNMINRTIGKEGRYSNHPSDRGGETIWGLTERVARANGYTGPIICMPRETAFDIFKKEYFIKPGFAGVALYNEAIAEELFDTGVNMGQTQACKMLQHALNGLNRRQKDYPNVVIDGDIGPATLKALQKYLAFRGGRGIIVMLKALNVLQGARYFDITPEDDQNEDFLFGWLDNRIGV